MTGKTMAEIDLQDNYGANVVAIRHEAAVTLSPKAKLTETVYSLLARRRRYF